MRPRPSPPYPVFTGQPPSTLLGLALAVALILGLGLPLTPLTTPRAAADQLPSIEVLLHFKDAGLRTVDFTGYSVPLTRESDVFVAQVNDDPATLSYDDRLSFAVYEHYATFGNRQRDLTELCTYDARKGTVTIPCDVVEDIGTVAMVFSLSPAHPAYQHFIASYLDTTDLVVEHRGRTVKMQSDVPDVIAAARQADKASTSSPLARLAAAFPGTTNKHYQLNTYTRLENFDVDMKKKQASYGFPSNMIGSYGFGVFFGSRQVYENGASTGTTWDKSVLRPSSVSYDEAVDAFLGDTIAARLGSKAEFAHSRQESTYRPCYVSTGGSYQDAGYGPGESPNNKAMAHGTCGSANVVNGGGAITMDPAGDNYIAYKGVYRNADSPYDGWFKLYYKFDAKSASTGMSFQDVVGYVLAPPPNTGRGQAVKVSANPSISGANNRYSMKNAVIAVFTDKEAAQAAAEKAQKRPWETWREARDWAQDRAAFTFVTKEDGKSNIVEDIEAGKYYAAELFAPKGFRLFDKVKTLTIEPRDADENPDTVTFVDEPQRGSIDLLKVSANPTLTTDNPCYALAGAVYGVFTDAACLNKYGDMTVSLNGQGQAVGRIDQVPLGPYWVKETKRASKGYALDPRTYPVTITDNVVTRVNVDRVAESPKLDPFRILLQKVDRATGEPMPQGGSSLGDAHFRINYFPLENATAGALAAQQPTASWLVRTNDEGVFPLQEAEGSFLHRSPRGEEQQLPYTISGSPYYKLQDGRIGMPIGSYTIQEVQAPEGYLPDTTVHVRHVNDEDHDREVLANFHPEEDGDIVNDEVARSDLRFTKRTSGSTRLAGIPFKVTSRTTGEWHILVTDKNGLASTESNPAHPHSQRTNENDRQFQAEDGSFAMPLVVDESLLDASAGLWFAGHGSQGAAASDALGALPYDIYDIEELRCPSNQLFSMIHDEVRIDTVDHGEVINMGTLINVRENTPALRTAASDGESGTHEGVTAPEATIVDRVFYRGLTPACEYTLVAVVMNADTGEPFTVEGETVSAEKTFVPEKPTGVIAMELSFPAEQLDDTRLVVFESLYRGDSEVALHADLTDENQTVTYRTPEEPEEPEPAPPEIPEEPPADPPDQPQEPDELEKPEEPEEPEATVTEVKEKAKKPVRLSQTGDMTAPLVGGALLIGAAAAIALIASRRVLRRRTEFDLRRGGRR